MKSVWFKTIQKEEILFVFVKIDFLCIQDLQHFIYNISNFEQEFMI